MRSGSSTSGSRGVPVSRNRGRWQRLLLDGLASGEPLCVTWYVVQQLGRWPDRSEYASAHRAAVLLARRGLARAHYVWTQALDGRRAAMIWLFPPDQDPAAAALPLAQPCHE